MSDRVVIGTPKKLVLDGMEYQPAADADPDAGKPKYEVTAEMSSGRTFFKMVRQNESSEGWSIRCDSDEYEMLKALNDQTEAFPMSMTFASGDVYKAQGRISVGPRKAQSGTADVVCYPTEKGWTLF